MNKLFLLNIPLTRLKHKVMELTTTSGRKIQGMFIPFEPNYMTQQDPKDKDAWHLPTKVILRSEPDRFNKYGFLKLIVDSETYKNSTKEELVALEETLPYLGNLFDPKESKDSEGKIQEHFQAPEPIGGNDLPF